VRLGTTDYFESVYNEGVTSTATATTLSLAGIQIPVPASLRQAQLNAPVQLNAGQSLGQSFTAKAGFSRVGGQFPTWSSSTTSLKLTLYRGTPATGLTEVGSNTLSPVQDNGWGYVDVPPQPAGVYYLEASDGAGTPGWWCFSGTATVNVGGAAYANRQSLTGRSMTIDIVGFTVDGIGSWDLELNGP
jgi:hypothetical protein